jgi:hypothetical protein
MYINILKMTGTVIYTGVCVIVAFTVVMFFTITELDTGGVGWIIYQVLGRISEYAGMMLLFFILKGAQQAILVLLRICSGEPLKKSFHLKNWMTTSPQTSNVIDSDKKTATGTENNTDIQPGSSGKHSTSSEDQSV